MTPAPAYASPRRMYAWRLGEVLLEQDIMNMRGIEGARMRKSYSLLAAKYGIDWHGRRYDRQDPESADAPNQAINHAATALEAAATIAVAGNGHLAAARIHSRRCLRSLLSGYCRLVPH